MAQKVTQSLVNQKCDLLKSQNEEITVNKVRKLIGGAISIIDLVDKVTLYKENYPKALELAQVQEDIKKEEPKDSLLMLVEETLKEFAIDKKDCVISLRSKLTKYIDNEIATKTKKIREKQTELSNKNDSLEISNLILNKRCVELLAKYNELKDQTYVLKQNYNSTTIKYLEKDNFEKTLLAWEDFKELREQLTSLGAYSKVAAYDKRGHIVIKFPATDFLTQECRAGVSRYLKAKTVYDYNVQAWVLSEFADIFKTLDFLRRNKFVFSKELETIEYHRKQSIL
ncbi:hypothetical protein IB642_06270 [Allofrancisella guangzhouensis]|uniref:Uncharacterized protein n=1 Tax=Allofrancisella guangzhouensis TaxID=594679 RepID=A0A0A8E6R4_9GAMM|nr:hypothetical protein [Allofrancisella guangzhouensis]AJC49292.1 hypothetical protein SD28_06450 [Allofrancisella guangzhouensis]MBK2027189.1 hypothetical protein [Allofrancisella guangzhouensis]MBK2044625.1 hypothetical protein [Allofrancisella guangzhouensis]MBK2045092.1 hypothetical protein [Allofrancisella guangzhouensis]